MEFISLIKDLGNQSGYLNIIKVAFLTFPFLAMLITIPYIISQYRKYGSIHSLRTVIVYSFVLYLLTAYFMIILPLPSIESVKNLTRASMQLIPFKFITDIIKTTPFVFNDVSTYLKSLAYSSVYVVLYNIILTIPFGMYLRYYFKKDLKTTIFYSFLLSLFFELTQLSGLYFIYPRSYRLFDVDDLILNTLGGTLGYFISSILFKILPKRDEIDKSSYESGKQISFLRRTIAFIIDLLLYLVLALITYYFIKSLLVSYFIYFVILTYLFKGQTLGKKFMKIRIVTTDDKKVRIIRLFIREFSILIVYFILPILSIYLMNYIPSDYYALCLISTLIFFIILYLITLIRLFKKKQLIHELITQTKLVSTIEFEEEQENTEESEVIMNL